LSRPPKFVFELLHVRHLPSQEGPFQVFVHVNLLGSEIDDLLRRSHRSLHLIGGHAHLNNLRFLRLLRRLLLALLTSLLLAALLITALCLLRIVADGEQLPEKNTTSSATRFGESALRRMP